MSDQGQSQAAAVEADLRSSLLTYDQVHRYNERITELTGFILQLELAGDAATVSMQIGQFQFWKGKIEAYQDLIEDHNAAAEQTKQP